MRNRISSFFSPLRNDLVQVSSRDTSEFPPTFSLLLTFHFLSGSGKAFIIYLLFFLPPAVTQLFWSSYNIWFHWWIWTYSTSLLSSTTSFSGWKRKRSFKKKRDYAVVGLRCMHCLAETTIQSFSPRKKKPRSVPGHTGLINLTKPIYWAFSFLYRTLR